VIWGISFGLAMPILWYASGVLRRRGSSAILAFQVIALLLAGFVLVFPLGARTPLLYPVVSLMICRHYFKKRLGLKTMLGAAVVFLVLAVAYQLHRFATLGYVSFGDIGGLLGDPKSVWQYLSGELMVLGDLALAVAVWPAYRPFMLGQSYLMFLVTPIPRILWASKPSWEVSSLMNVEIYGPDQAGVWGGRGVGMIGESYVNFGVLGAVAIPVLVGVVSRVAYDWVTRNRHGSLAAPIYAAFLFSLFIALRGELVAGVIQFVQFLIPLMLIYFCASTRVPRVTGAQEAGSALGPR